MNLDRLKMGQVASAGRLVKDFQLFKDLCFVYVLAYSLVLFVHVYVCFLFFSYVLSMFVLFGLRVQSFSSSERVNPFSHLQSFSQYQCQCAVLMV